MKTQVEVGYCRGSGLAGYRDWKQAGLLGADIKAQDGSGNTIEVYVREAEGYRVVINGKEVAQGQ